METKNAAVKTTENQRGKKSQELLQQTCNSDFILLVFICL